MNMVSSISSTGCDILLMETIKALITQVLQFASKAAPSLSHNSVSSEFTDIIHKYIFGCLLMSITIKGP